MRGEDLEGLALDIPDLVDVEDDLRLEIAHFRLMRLEQENPRRGILVFRIRLVTHRLRHHPRLLRKMRRIGMIEIVGILKRVGEHKTGVEFAIDIDHPVEMGLVELQRIVTAIKELDFGAKHRCGAFGLVLAPGLDGGQ